MRDHTPEPRIRRRSVLASVAALATAGALGTPEYLAKSLSTEELAFGMDSNWRLYGHDTGNTFANPRADGPAENPSLQWQFDWTTDGADGNGNLAGYFQSTPLIVDGTVYTVADNEDDTVSFVGIDAETGSVERLFDASSIYRPTIVDGTAYVGVGPTICAYDLETGTRQWSQTPEMVPGEEIHYYPSSIRRVGNSVVVSHYGGDFTSSSSKPSVTVLDAETGAVRWQRDTIPRIGERLSIVTAESVLLPDTTAIFDRETGEVRRQLPTAFSDPTLHAGNPILYAGNPILHAGTLYGCVTATEEPNALVAYDWETLEEQWRHQGIGAVKSVVGDVVVALDWEGASGATDHLVSIIGFDRVTGEQRWCIDPTELFDGEIDIIRDVMVVATDETIYVTYGEGTAAALEPEDGSVRWFRQPTSSFRITIPLGCSVADDLLVTVGPGTLYAFS